MTSAIQNGSLYVPVLSACHEKKTYSQCYGCREYGHHRNEYPRRIISPFRRSPGLISSNSPTCARYQRPCQRFQNVYFFDIFVHFYGISLEIDIFILSTTIWRPWSVNFAVLMWGDLCFGVNVKIWLFSHLCDYQQNKCLYLETLL